MLLEVVDREAEKGSNAGLGLGLHLLQKVLPCFLNLGFFSYQIHFFILVLTTQEITKSGFKDTEH